MYRSGKDYEKMARLVIDIYTDYNITSFPVDEKNVCSKLGVKLVPYSSKNKDERELLMKESKDAFYSPATRKTPPTIFYNDDVDILYGRMRYSIFHEIKHYVNNDTEDNKYNDDMADYFSRYFMCPIPYLIKANVVDESFLISEHLVTDSAARNTMSNVRNRRAKYGDMIFDYEQPLIDLLFPDNFKEECL